MVRVWDWFEPILIVRSRTPNRYRMKGNFQCGTCRKISANWPIPNLTSGTHMSMQVTYRYPEPLPRGPKHHDDEHHPRPRNSTFWDLDLTPKNSTQEVEGRDDETLGDEPQSPTLRVANRKATTLTHHARPIFATTPRQLRNQLAGNSASQNDTNSLTLQDVKRQVNWIIVNFMESPRLTSSHTQSRSGLSVCISLCSNNRVNSEEAAVGVLLFRKSFLSSLLGELQPAARQTPVRGQ
ncbi:hypothetical protein K440DRAFT_635935 [Wilcoxina mikolae CBS 423.85]|nr:hypothetical protein K440DRAFT_635935 [Wilcoxina mikolae CBS 423.85]